MTREPPLVRSGTLLAYAGSSSNDGIYPGDIVSLTEDADLLGRARVVILLGRHVGQTRVVTFERTRLRTLRGWRPLTSTGSVITLQRRTQA